MLHALRVNFENFGHTTKNKIFRLVKLLADLSTRLYLGMSLRAQQMIIFVDVVSDYLSTEFKYID